MHPWLLLLVFAISDLYFFKNRSLGSLGSPALDFQVVANSGWNCWQNFFCNFLRLWQHFLGCAILGKKIFWAFLKTNLTKKSNFLERVNGVQTLLYKIAILSPSRIGYKTTEKKTDLRVKEQRSWWTFYFLINSVATKVNKKRLGIQDKVNKLKVHV